MLIIRTSQTNFALFDGALRVEFTDYVVSNLCVDLLLDGNQVASIPARLNINGGNTAIISFCSEMMQLDIHERAKKAAEVPQ